jgi:hypothetical protein
MNDAERFVFAAAARRLAASVYLARGEVTEARIELTQAHALEWSAFYAATRQASQLPRKGRR